MASFENGWLRWHCSHLICAMFLPLILSACTERNTVTPEHFETFLRDEGSDHFFLRVDLTSRPPSYLPLDIVFLLDATGSMRNIVDTMRQNAVTITQQLNHANPNTAFGIASFGDYGGSDPVWTLEQDITQDRERVVAALGRIRMVDGGDLPEAYSRALYEMLFLGWRPGARRYVILFGDAPAHDTDFYGRDFGVDPGRDGIPGTADDLRFRDVVRQLSQNQITVIGIYDRGPWYGRKDLSAETERGFSFVAKETGGFAVPVTAADEVPKAIRQGLMESHPPVPLISIPDQFTKWLSISPPETLDGKGRHYRFKISVTAAKGTPAGVYDIPVRVLAGSAPDAAEVGRTGIRIRLGWSNYSWRWAFVTALLLIILAAIWWRATRQGGLVSPARRMVGKRTELTLLLRGASILTLIALLVVIVMALPETPALLSIR